jgi:DNA-binding transcriptional LysR family regulator
MGITFMLHSRLLVYLDEVARAGSIRKASERLNVAASAIDRQILALEQELGTPVFIRLPRKMVLTAAGEVLIRHVRDTMRDMERSRALIEELKGLRRGEFTVAIMSGLAANLVPRVVAEFRQANPRTRIMLRLLATGDEIIGAVVSGGADLGVGFDFPPTPNVRELVSAVGRLGAVMAPSHPLAGRAMLRISDCIAYPMILADSTMAIRPHLDQVFSRAKLEPNPVIETNSIEVMRHAAMSEQGITFLTPIDIEFEARFGRLAYVPVRELSAAAQRLKLIANERGSNVIASVFAEMLKAAIEKAGTIRE